MATQKRQKKAWLSSSCGVFNTSSGDSLIQIMRTLKFIQKNYKKIETTMVKRYQFYATTKNFANLLMQMVETMKSQLKNNTMMKRDLKHIFVGSKKFLLKTDKTLKNLKKIKKLDTNTGSEDVFYTLHKVVEP